MTPGVRILDFGSQFTQLIAREIRSQGVFCEIVKASPRAIADNPHPALILSGGPRTITPQEARRYAGLRDLQIPVLGICYGMQLLAAVWKGVVQSSSHREYGGADLEILEASGIFQGLPKHKPFRIWMSHGDSVTALPQGARLLARSPHCPIAAFSWKNFQAVQFHPEVFHTENGSRMIANFLFEVARLSKTWKVGELIASRKAEIEKQVGNRRVIGAVSGGVDSTVLAVLLTQTLGDRFAPFFVDTGLLREGEADWVLEKLRDLGVPLRCLRAGPLFLKRLRKVTDPEKKRKIIGKTFIEVFQKACKQVRHAELLAQGTLYPDVIESSSHAGKSVTIKTHHNVGGLPKKLGFELLEPFRDLFKDEVRILGAKLGIPQELLQRHPFPGPGLAVRILGEVTPARLKILRKADAIYLEELHRSGHYEKIWQAFSVLLPIASVGVMGDHRTYESVLALRAVTSRDGMTADWYPLPDGVLRTLSSRIVNSVPGINRVVYDVTSKPPATIEWE